MARRISGTIFFAVVAILSGVAPAQAVELNSKTLAAWNDYVRLTETRSQQRVGSGHFLWLDEDPQRAERVRKGEIEVVPFADGGFQRVPEGLIHDWMGAVFLPDTKLEEVLALLTDYDRYREIYGPEVVAAKHLSHFQNQDEFSMKIVNKALFVSAGVQMLCKSKSVRLDGHRAYSTSRTVNVEEIRDYGRANERALPVDTGDGFIWRLFSVARLEERDGGVYIETERLALTRDIPSSLNFLVAPVVKRLSRNSMTISLQKTRAASEPLAAASKRESALVSQTSIPAKSFVGR